MTEAELPNPCSFVGLFINMSANMTISVKKINAAKAEVTITQDGRDFHCKATMPVWELDISPLMMEFILREVKDFQAEVVRRRLPVTPDVEHEDADE